MKDLFGSFLATGGTQIANFATGILAAGILLPEGRGEPTILLLWQMLVADLGSFSLSTSTSFHMARKFGKRMEGIEEMLKHHHRHDGINARII